MARKVRLARARCTGASTGSSSLLATAVTVAVLLGATATAGLNQAALHRLLFVGPSSLPRARAWGAIISQNGESLESASAAARMQRSRWCDRGLVGERQRLRRCLPGLSMAASSDEDVSERGRLVGTGGGGGCIVFEARRRRGSGVKDVGCGSPLLQSG